MQIDYRVPPERAQEPAPSARNRAPAAPANQLDDLMRLLLENLQRASGTGETSPANPKPNDPRAGVVAAFAELFQSIAPLLQPPEALAATPEAQETAQRIVTPGGEPERGGPQARKLQSPLPRYTNGHLGEATAETTRGLRPAPATERPPQVRGAENLAPGSAAYDSFHSKASKASKAPRPQEPAPTAAKAPPRPMPEVVAKDNEPVRAPRADLGTLERQPTVTSDTGFKGKMVSLPTATGEKLVDQSIIVKAGQVFDGRGMHFKAGAGLGDNGRLGDQKPIFSLEPGAVLKNLQVSGGKGIHAFGDASLHNVWWRDVGENAFTLKAPGGDIQVNGGGAFNASGQVFRVDAPGSLSIEGFTAEKFGKFVHQNGGKDFPLDLKITNSNLDGGQGWAPAEAVFRTDAKQARVTLSGNTFSNLPNDVLAPEGADVVGAVNRGYKKFTG